MMWQRHERLETIRSRFESTITSIYDGHEALLALMVYADVLADMEAQATPKQQRDNFLAPERELKEIVKSIATKNNMDSDEVSQLSAIGDAYEKAGLTEFARLLRLWLAILRSVTEEPPEPSHCVSTIMLQSCSACGQESRYSFWLCVNISRRTELRTIAQNGDLTSGARCHFCDAPIGLMPFFYIDPSREEFLAYWPSDHYNGADSFAHKCRQWLLETPPELRGQKRMIVVVSDVPVACFKDVDVGAVTIIRSAQLFAQVVTEPVVFFAEPMMNIDRTVMKNYFRAKQLAEKGDNWAAACVAFAKLFLIDQSTVSRLGGVVASLRNLGRHMAADEIACDALRLRDRLIAEGVIERISRPSCSPAGRGIRQAVLIAEHGLPDEWGFSPLIERLNQLVRQSRTEDCG
jgi:hypothetical protein